MKLDKSVQKSQRPLIITIIGILEIIIGSALAISMGFSYVSVQHALEGGESQAKYILTTVMAAEGIGVVILGLFLLRSSKWAWMVTMAYFASGLFIQSIYGTFT